MIRRSPVPRASRAAGASTLALAIACTPVLVRAAPAPSETQDELAGPDSQARTEVELGHEAANAGDHEAAIEHYQAARELDPDLDVDEALAMSHFQIGTRAYANGEYEAALRRFQDAQGLYSSPNFHYNIGQCYEALERPQQAIDSYRAFLRAVPDTPDRANIESKIARLEKRASEASERPADEPPPPVPPAASPEPERKHPGRALIASGSVLTGLGAAVAVGGGLAFGLQASDRSDRVNAVFEDGNPEGLTLAETERLDEQGRRAQTGQVIMLTTGGAVAVVGITLIVLGVLEKRRAGNLEAAAPLLGRGLAGLSVSGRF